MKVRILLLMFLVQNWSFAQDSSSVTNSYRDQFILYSDLSFKAAPFTLRDNYNEGLKKLAFKHNFRPSMGIGFAYKWIALRIGFALPGHMRPISRFGKSNFTDLGVKFNIKSTFWDIDFRNYRGYVIKNAYFWNDTLDAITPNDVRSGQNAASFSINTWYIRNKEYKMNSVIGIKGDFNGSAKSWYFRGTLNFFGIGNDNGSITPADLIDTTDSKSYASSLSALDLGIIPGYAYTFKQNNWQVSGFGGLGLVLQGKFYAAQNITRGFLGIAPRFDLRLIGGYTKKNYFFWLFTDFDIKSIRFQEMRYNQVYYQVGLMGGYRFNKRVKKEKDNKK